MVWRLNGRQEVDAMESETRYRTFISNSYIGIWRVEALSPIPLHLSVEEQVDWVYEHVYFTDCNDAAARIYGFDAAEDLIGKMIGEVLPRDYEANEAVIRRIVESGYDLVDDEWHEVNPAGETIMTFNSLVSTIEDGYVVDGWGVLIDIKARKQTEQALEKYRKMLDEAEKLAQMGSFEWDVPTNQILWSDELYRIYGLDPEVFEATFEAFLNHIHPDDRATLVDTLKEAIEARAAFQMEERIIQNRGDVRHLVTRGEVTTDDEGNPLKMTGVCMDITARKQVEERLRQSEEKFAKAFRSSPDAVTISVLDGGTFIDVNDSFERISGYSPEEAIGSSFQALNLWLNLEDRARMIALLQTEGQVRNQEVQFRIKSGAVRTCLVSAEIIEVDGVAYVLAVTRDVTEEKQAEALRQRLITELEARNAELERFTYTVSHDLKTPLVTIKGFLGLLEQDALAGNVERMKADIDKIASAADKMGRLLSELLDLSRIGRLVNPPEEVPLTELAHEAATLVAGPIKQGGVEVIIAPDMPVVYGDRLRLLEVLQNLLDNAVRFMGSQTAPRVEIEARQEQETVTCFVQDNGMGIAPAYHEKVFGLFERLDPGSEGTGIGLALAKRIVDVHEGRIWVESKGVGHGSTFCFSLASAEASA